MKKRKILIILEDIHHAFNDYHEARKKQHIQEQEKLKIQLQCLSDEYQLYFIEDHRQLVSKLEQNSYDLIINMCDYGFMGKVHLVPHIMALCDIYDHAYLGKNLSCHFYTNEKNVVNGLLQSLGIRVPQEIYIANQVVDTKKLFYPGILKYAFNHGSELIDEHSVIHNAKQLKKKLYEMHTFRQEPVLYQEYIDGREFSVGLIGNDESLALPILEYDFQALPSEKPHIFTESAKEHQEDCIFYQNIQLKEAILPDDVKNVLIDQSKTIFKRLAFRDFGRFDWRYSKDNTLYFIDANANPGLRPQSHFTLMCQLKEWSYSQMMHTLITSAFHRM